MKIKVKTETEVDFEVPFYGQKYGLSIMVTETEVVKVFAKSISINVMDNYTAETLLNGQFEATTHVEFWDSYNKTLKTLTDYEP